MNMDYCKFRNTAMAISQCLGDWYSDENESEKRAKQKIIEMAKEILEAEGFEIKEVMQMKKIKNEKLLKKIIKEIGPDKWWLE